jgi:hypothetical protein
MISPPAGYGQLYQAGTRTGDEVVLLSLYVALMNPDARPFSQDANIWTLKYLPCGTRIVCPSARTLSFPAALYWGKVKLMPLYTNLEGGNDLAGYPAPCPSKLESFGFIENPRLLYRFEISSGVEGVLPEEPESTYFGLNNTCGSARGSDNKTKNKRFIFT